MSPTSEGVLLRLGLAASGVVLGRALSTGWETYRIVMWVVAMACLFWLSVLQHRYAMAVAQTEAALYELARLFDGLCTRGSVGESAGAGEVQGEPRGVGVCAGAEDEGPGSEAKDVNP